MELLWWHWVVLGLALIVLELAIPSFFIIWFGLGAVCVGIVMIIFSGLALGIQVLLWIIFSLIFVWLWFKVFKQNLHRTKVGLSKGQFVGEVGLVVRDIVPYERGETRFQKPILGADTWLSIADEEIKAGERVRVVDVEGNILKVKKV